MGNTNRVSGEAFVKYCLRFAFIERCLCPKMCLLCIECMYEVFMCDLTGVLKNSLQLTQINYLGSNLINVRLVTKQLNRTYSCVPTSVLLTMLWNILKCLTREVLGFTRFILVQMYLLFVTYWVRF